MRKDLIIGIVVSASLIGGLLLGFNGRPEKVKHGPVQTDDTIQIEMPTLPPEPPEIKKTQEDLPPEDDAVQVTFAPPSLVDIPTIVADATDPYDIALRLERYLRARYQYDLRPPASDFAVVIKSGSKP